MSCNVADQPQNFRRYLFSRKGAMVWVWSLFVVGWCAFFVVDLRRGKFEWVTVFNTIVVLLCAIMEVSGARHKWERQTRAANGWCLVCGYDLRASGKICPECGASTEPAPENTRPTVPSTMLRMLLKSIKQRVYEAVWKDVPLKRKKKGNAMVTAFIALGANLGDRSKTLRAALVRLDETPGVRVKAVSSFLENPAIGGPENSPAFLNAVVEIQTTLLPRELLDRLLEIERALGRERREKWGPRTIDLDILLYGNSVIAEDDLVVPHVRMRERRFVLQPLFELAPDLVVPGGETTVRELLLRV